MDLQTLTPIGDFAGDGLTDAIGTKRRFGNVTLNSCYGGTVPSIGM
jgi:hypothetical protein